MLGRVLQIGLSLYLVLGISGLAPVVSEALAEHGDCCSDCDDPGCPEQDGEQCPPQCDDCVCPCWIAPIVIAGASDIVAEPPVHTIAYATGDVTHEPPVLRGVFRPPRLWS